MFNIQFYEASLEVSKFQSPIVVNRKVQLGRFLNKTSITA